MEYVKLEDVVDIYLGLTHTPTYVDDGVPFLSVKDISDGKIIFDKCHFIKEEEYNSLPNGARPKVGDMLFCRVGTIGKPVIIEEGIPKFGTFVSLGFLRNKNEEKTLLKYLLYWMNSELFFKQVRQNVKGASQVNLNTGWLSKFVLPAYSLDIQNEIVCILDKITALINKRKQQLSKLDELVKVRFVELFGSLNDNEKGLDIVSIEELCALIKDGTHQTPTYTEDKQNGFKFLSSKDVMTQKICWDDIKYIPAELHEKLYATIQPQRNDILMSKNGVNYGVAAVNDTDEVFDIYVSLALLRPRTDMVNPVYLRCAINNPDTKHQFDSSIKGIGVPNLHLGEIKKTKVLLPPMGKQKEFVCFVEQTDKAKLEIQKGLEKLELLKKALMQKYFG